MRAVTATESSSVDLEDIQGLLRFGYNHLKQACFLLLRVTDQRAARAWLAKVPISNAVKSDVLPERALQVALTCDGLRALGVSETVIQGFSVEFVAGIASDENRSRRLGDVDGSAPQKWRWGYARKHPHVLVMLYAESGALKAWQEEISGQCAAGFEQLACLDTADMDGREPFGFVDGISQPRIDWGRSRNERDEERQLYDNLSCVGEFLLGYPNEYGGFTDRPLLKAAGKAARQLPRAEDDAEKADLGRNGSYLVFRQLEQDVAGFWQFLDRQAEGDPELRRRWAEKMVGRTLDGEPLADPTAISPNAFDYQHDTAGLRCPLGAHIRRANPRNGDLPPGKAGFIGWLLRTLAFDRQARERDRIASTRFHRLVRRGRGYGKPPSLEKALAAKTGKSNTGLHFICLNANIARQFEFVQSAWIVGTRFDGLNSEGDPLLGSREPGADGYPTDCFSMPQGDGPDQRLCGLARFIHVRGGAYFFLPGIRALRYLVTAS